MNRFFICYPGFLTKALTLSYDDGTEHDIRMVQILNRHGIKGTFNLNSGHFDGTLPGTGTRRYLTVEEAKALYLPAGHEIGAHSVTHPFLPDLPAGCAAWELARDRERLEEIFGTIIRGMAYPMGPYDEDSVSVARQCGLAYARTTKCHRTFQLPKDWLQLESTCRHKDPRLDELCDQYLTMPHHRRVTLFYMWGHSYEFNDDANWDVLERFCEKMGGRDDIWYATNLEVCDYLQAARQIRSSINGTRLYNPTATTLYLDVAGERRTLAPGQTMEV